MMWREDELEKLKFDPVDNEPVDNELQEIVNRGIFGLNNVILAHILSLLPLRQMIICRLVCRQFYRLLTSAFFIHFISAKKLLHPLLCFRALSVNKKLRFFDTNEERWFSLDLTSLPCDSVDFVASSGGVVYMWGPSLVVNCNHFLIACNPLTQNYKVLIELSHDRASGSSVVPGSSNQVMVVYRDDVLFIPNPYLSISFTSRLVVTGSTVLISNTVYALSREGCRAVVRCELSKKSSKLTWGLFNRNIWFIGDLNCPHLLEGVGNSILMAAGSMNRVTKSQTMKILCLDLNSNHSEWEEVAEMPEDIFNLAFVNIDPDELEVFGWGNMVCFAVLSRRKLALWQGGCWKLFDNFPDFEVGPEVTRFDGFILKPVFDALA